MLWQSSQHTMVKVLWDIRKFSFHQLSPKEPLQRAPHQCLLLCLHHTRAVGVELYYLSRASSTLHRTNHMQQHVVTLRCRWLPTPCSLLHGIVPYARPKYPRTNNFSSSTSCSMHTFNILESADRVVNLQNCWRQKSSARDNFGATPSNYNYILYFLD